MSHFSSEDLIFHKIGDKIVSAGFGVNSILLNKGLSPILSLTTDYNSDGESTSSSSSDSDSDSDSDRDGDKNKGDKVKKQVFKTFKNLASPVGLFSMKEQTNNHHKESDESKESTYLPDNIYDELLKLVDYSNKKSRQSKKNKKHLKRSKTYKASK